MCYCGADIPCHGRHCSNTITVIHVLLLTALEHNNLYLLILTDQLEYAAAAPAAAAFVNQSDLVPSYSQQPCCGSCPDEQHCSNPL